MTPVHDDLLTILDAVEILSPSRYALLGRLRQIPDDALSESSSTAGPTLLTLALADHLYEWLYLRPSPPPLTPIPFKEA